MHKLGVRLYDKLRELVQFLYRLTQGFFLFLSKYKMNSYPYGVACLSIPQL